jgi:hypothetical protein
MERMQFGLAAADIVKLDIVRLARGGVTGVV